MIQIRAVEYSMGNKPQSQEQAEDMLNHLDRKILKYIMEEKHPVSNKELSCNVHDQHHPKGDRLINEEMENMGYPSPQDLSGQLS